MLPRQTAGCGIIGNVKCQVRSKRPFVWLLRNGWDSSDLVIFGWSSLSRLPIHLGRCHRVASQPQPHQPNPQELHEARAAFCAAAIVAGSNKV
jgi:hypothetical protein